MQIGKHGVEGNSFPTVYTRCAEPSDSAPIRMRGQLVHVCVCVCVHGGGTLIKFSM